MLPLLFLLCTTSFPGLAHSTDPAPISPRRGDLIRHSEVRTDLTIDEFLAEVSRRKKQTSPSLPLYKRAPLGQESRNNLEVNAVIEELHRVCRSITDSHRSTGGKCRWEFGSGWEQQGENREPKTTREIHCQIPEQAGSQRSALRRCPQGQVCRIRRGYNYAGDWVEFPFCEDEIPFLRDKDNFVAVYSVSKPGPGGAQAVSYHVDIDWPATNAPGRNAFFEDTSGKKGWARSWSCFFCPPGLVTIHSHLPAVAFGHVV
ncbi:uncharacterized protein UV8b_01488 [Ustilaginoidea virens]|uniref:Secreted in xylem 1 protein n=1 Tax=Ustilaginoidea virens TaxID=1159556 RepID=A0A8E5HL13_USTVR|nr:uncharacterized protein UV8b_01488 [Ustilaginoidea virens]QUC17247.1 hypothetical protein UV8b_01488 [Ustilaginoidea virens]